MYSHLIAESQTGYSSTVVQPTTYSETTRPETRIVLVPEVRIDITPATPVVPLTPDTPWENKEIVVKVDDRIKAAEDIIERTTAEEVTGHKLLVTEEEKPIEKETSETVTRDFSVTSSTGIN